MNQRVSLNCCESALSPVRIVRSSCAPVTGETVFRACRTMASVTCVVSDSCGRYAAETGLSPGADGWCDRPTGRAIPSANWKSDSAEVQIDASAAARLTTSV